MQIHNVVGMRVTGRRKLQCFWERHSDAETWLRSWYAVIKASRWDSLVDVRKAYRHADAVKVASGRTVTVFNVCGNRYRMAVAIHYDAQRVYVLWLGTHAEYSRDAWKGTL